MLAVMLVTLSVVVPALVPEPLVDLAYALVELVVVVIVLELLIVVLMPLVPGPLVELVVVVASWGCAALLGLGAAGELFCNSMSYCCSPSCRTEMCCSAVLFIVMLSES